jgi:hypothetical protein
MLEVNSAIKQRCSTMNNGLLVYFMGMFLYWVSNWSIVYVFEGVNDSKGNVGGVLPKKR